MNIYDYKTFEINSLSQAKFLIENNFHRKINFVHKYKSVVWQGPIYLKTIYNNIISKKINYIVETRDDIGLFVSLINLEFKFFALSSKVESKYKEKFFSIAQKKKVKVLIIEKLRIQSLIEPEVKL